MFTERLSYWSGVALAAAVAVGSVKTAGAADAPPQQPSQQELLDKINVLQTQVNQLKEIAQKQQVQNQETAAKVEESTAAALQRDTERASQFQLLQDGGFTSGYSDGRFTLQSTDKNYVFHPWLQVQSRYEATYRDNAQHGGKDPDTQAGFELRRLKFGFDGNIVSPDLLYWLQFAVDRKTGTVSLEQAYAKYRFNGTGLYIKGGQYKEPLDHEQILASRYLTAEERTLSNDLFSNSEGFVQGVSVGFDNGGAFRAELAFTDGMRSANTNFQQFSTGTNTADYGIVARGEFKAFGNWKDYDRTTGAYGTKSDFLVLGVGNDYTEAGNTHTLTSVVDVDYGNTSGLGLYAAFTNRAFSHAAIGSLGSNGGTTGKTIGVDGDDWSLRGQASYAINTHWEPYLQYEYIYLNQGDLPAGSKNLIQVIRAGVNYYIYRTEARVTFDASYFPGGSPVSDDGIGLLGTGAATKTAGFTHGGGNEFIFRAQFQLNL